MKRARLKGLLLLLLGSVLFVWWGLNFERRTPISMVDFKVVYYGTRCLLQHHDPYNESNFRSVYFSESSEPEALKQILHHNVTVYIYFPTAFICILPLALLPWVPAHLIWIFLTALTVIAAALLMWNLAAEYAPVMSGGLLCLFLTGSDLLIEVGNAAGVAIALCAIATWCFVRQRFVHLGVLCLGISMALKPHDAGFILLYFLLAGSLYRKFALRTIAVTAVITLLGVIWVSQVAPNWLRELQANLAVFSAHGDTSDPGPAGVDPRIHGAITITLQTVFSVFRDDPRFYNLASYIICAPLLLLWLLATLKARPSAKNTWLALAAISTLSMLPVYHRQHDTRLLMLSVPACAVLWAEGGATAWFAVVITAAGAVFTANDTLQFIAVLTDHMQRNATGLSGQLLTVLLDRPAPIVLFVMGVFYLWVFVRHAFGSAVVAMEVETPINASATSIRV